MQVAIRSSPEYREMTNTCLCPGLNRLINCSSSFRSSQFSSTWGRCAKMARKNGGYVGLPKCGYLYSHIKATDGAARTGGGKCLQLKLFALSWVWSMGARLATWVACRNCLAKGWLAGHIISNLRADNNHHSGAPHRLPYSIYPFRI